MSNIPDNLRACDDPASDGDVPSVICDQSGCMNVAPIDSDDAASELTMHGGVTCYECAGASEDIC